MLSAMSQKPRDAKPAFYHVGFPGQTDARDRNVWNVNYIDSAGNKLQVTTSRDYARDFKHQDVVWFLHNFSYSGPGDWVKFDPNVE